MKTTTRPLRTIGRPTTHKRLPRAGAVDLRRLDDLMRNELEDAAHDQHADREIQRDVGQDQAARRVDQVQTILDLVDADDRDDADREVERDQEHRDDDAAALRPHVHERIARQHRADRGDAAPCRRSRRCC